MNKQKIGALAGTVAALVALVPAAQAAPPTSSSWLTKVP